MRKIAFLVSAAALMGAPARADLVANFDGLPYTGGLNYENGQHLSPAGGFTSGGAFFNNDYNSSFDSWTDWSYSRVNNPTTPGYGNQYAAVTGTAASGESYGVAYASGYTTTYLNVPLGHNASSMKVTNTAYAYFTIRDGDQFSTAFSVANQDYFLLTITGFSGANGTGTALGSIPFYLADFRTGPGTILDTWATIDLTGLFGALSLVFTLESTDVGINGMNTPAYFAADDIVFTAADVVSAPEPASLACALVGTVMLAGAARARRRRQAVLPRGADRA